MASRLVLLDSVDDRLLRSWTNPSSKLTPLSPERGDGSVPPTVTALLVGALVFDAFCLVSLVRNEASNLPKWVWAVVICGSCPLGGLAYLAFGRAGEVLQAPELPGPLPEPPDALRERSAHAPRPAGRGPVMIEVDELVKRFGPVTALDGLSFTVRPGQVTGFLGPNGAGKPVTELRLSWPLGADPITG
jgi:ABC-type multidrug transport system fused ATPase/permease subunit